MMEINNLKVENAKIRHYFKVPDEFIIKDYTKVLEKNSNFEGKI